MSEEAELSLHGREEDVCGPSWDSSVLFPALSSPGGFSYGSTHALLLSTCP